MIKVNFSSEVDEARTKQILAEIKADPMGGWMELPHKYDVGELARIKEAAKKIQEESEYLVCIGIGGSYLGHRAVIEALRPESEVKIVYAGNSLSARELQYVMNEVGDHDFSINVISKSGTTLEPAIAFDAFRAKLVEKYGAEEAGGRIYATTDANRGALHDEAVEKGYTRFVVPDNIGGRYSVLTAVGMLPMCVAGVDVDKLLEGAGEMCASDFEKWDGVDLVANPAVQYAWMRHILRGKGYDTEVFASFEPATIYFNEWLKQLFGESEGKERQGVWPASVVYSTDLHSLGQFMQDGRRNIWETIIDYPTDETNAKVVQAVRTAHGAGGIPVLTIGVPSYDEKGFGELVYFFELACALSAKLAGVNPFDQPGVKAYKNELKKLMAE
ncbi:glucose-6-phosphate isomerase [Candidatus Saccharibacteria bacterium]|nr:glucose-6-phosphate isomerase [Candidatus Saccharibacteria bacterium]